MPNRTQAFKSLVTMARLCNNSHFIESAENKDRAVNQRLATGDATDIALLRFSEANRQDFVEADYAEMIQVPFNSRNKWMMKVFRLNDDEHRSSYMILKASALVHLLIIIILPHSRELSLFKDALVSFFLLI